MHGREMPDLDEEHFDMITNNIERLFDYIAYLQKIRDIINEVKDEIHNVKSEVHELKDRKRKVVKSTEMEDKAPMKRVRRR